MNVIGSCWYKGREYGVLEVDAHNRPQRLTALDGSFQFYCKRDFVEQFKEFVEPVALEAIKTGKTTSDLLLASLEA